MHAREVRMAQLGTYSSKQLSVTCYTAFIDCAHVTWSDNDQLVHTAQTVKFAASATCACFLV